MDVPPPLETSVVRRVLVKDGDRVVFYGDSITDQRLYTVFTEAYVVTRFPKRNITFVHSGVGGDRVGGGGMGPIDLRLDRDVVAYKPTGSGDGVAQIVVRRMTLYQHWRGGDLNVATGQVIELTTQPVHFGGRRWYFICPRTAPWR